MTDPQILAASMKLRTQTLASQLIKAMASFPNGGIQVDEAEIPFEQHLLRLGVLTPDDFIEEIDTDDIHAEGTANLRHTVVIVTIANERIIQINADTGEVLIIVE